MSESPIADAVENALSAALQEKGQMLTDFLAIGVTLTADGGASLTIVHPPSQPTHAALGLVAYLEEWFKDDVRFQISTLCAGDEE